MPLDRYHEKRRFDVTPEPSGDGTVPELDDAADRAGGTEPTEAPGRSFVIQKHAASRLHYDFRLEIAGVLASWAVPKGPSLDTRDRRLAMHVEDHPLEYGSFAGTIPAGQYGAGTVEIWDSGTYEPVGEFDSDYAARKPIKFVLHGRRLSGGFTLVPLKPRGNERGDSWLLIKERDEHTRPCEEYDVLAEEPPTAAIGLAEGPGDDPIPADEPFQLATLAEEVPVGEQWLHEVKYDGYRLRVIKDHGRVSVRTRNGLDWTGRFPGVAAAAADLPVSSAVLDGEAVVFSDDGLSDFGALQHSLSHSDSAGVRYVAFDLLYLDGHDLRGLPLRQRKELLDGLLGSERGPRAATLMLAEHYDGSGPEFWRQACALSLEGVISKRAERPYIGGRSRDWIKIKCALRQEFVVVGFT
ncbi:MAG: DNA polymerase ligase N-terminal domain-containing protein, partial [Actinomycetota bacterium]|nr:DNA polymerase ligase N-terminal domain-containing protein [Actinomycetota bacterium]